jgi:hypothetical protein
MLNGDYVVTNDLTIPMNQSPIRQLFDIHAKKEKNQSNKKMMEINFFLKI